MLEITTFKLRFKNGEVEISLAEFYQLKKDMDKLFEAAQNKGEIYQKLRELEKSLKEVKENTQPIHPYYPPYPAIWISEKPETPKWWTETICCGDSPSSTGFPQLAQTPE